MSNFNVTGFLETLEQSQSKAPKTVKKENQIEKLYLSYPGNYGKYQVFPVNSVTTGFPFSVLPQTREIKINKTLTLPDGTEKSFESWIKILPSEAYVMQDSTGRVVSSLTSAEETLLRKVQSAFDILYNELGGNSKERNPNLNKTIGFMRRRNYTVFYGKCLSKWTKDNPRTPEKTNFPALFICTAKGFIDQIKENIADYSFTQGNEAWLEQVYNRDMTGRTGFLLFSISIPDGQIGYNITANHNVSANPVNGMITEEEMSMMQDPVEGFLGWQASKEPGKLFNAALMEETLNNMTSILSSHRSSGVIDPVAAASITTNSALSANQGYQSNDPMLQANYSQTMINPEAVMNGNTNPYSNPPQAQIDPISQNPVMGNAGNAPFSSPGFAQGGFQY